MTRANPTETEEPRVHSAPYRHALIVANPISGRGQGGNAAAELREGLRQRGVAAETFETGARGDAFTRLRCLEPTVDLVVAVGGDGTLREVIEGLVDPAIPIGILPFGTANVLANELGIPRDVHHNLEILFRNKIQAIDVARVNGHLSFLITGIGIDAMAVREVEERRDGPITKWSYVEAMVRTLRRYRPPRLAMRIDGEELPEPYGLALISNTVGYGGLLHLAADARMDDGLFEVYLFPTGRITELASAFVRGIVRRLPGGAVEMRRARSVSVTSQEPVPYQVDGDLGGHAPVHVRGSPWRARLLVPAGI